jgi:predicted GIY-YIG superfamily endonuclease
MGKPKPYTKYVVRVKGKIVHGGITTEFERRKQEHKQKWPNSIIRKVGGKATEESARKWEEEQGFS